MMYKTVAGADKRSVAESLSVRKKLFPYRYPKNSKWQKWQQLDGVALRTLNLALMASPARCDPCFNDEVGKRWSPSVRREPDATDARTFPRAATSLEVGRAAFWLCIRIVPSIETTTVSELPQFGTSLTP